MTLGQQTLAVQGRYKKGRTQVVAHFLERVLEPFQYVPIVQMRPGTTDHEAFPAPHMILGRCIAEEYGIGGFVVLLRLQKLVPAFHLHGPERRCGKVAFVQGRILAPFAAMHIDFQGVPFTQERNRFMHGTGRLAYFFFGGAFQIATAERHACDKGAVLHQYHAFINEKRPAQEISQSFPRHAG